MLDPRFTLYFIRHGETDWNAAGRMQGQTDIALNNKGRGQARRNGETLQRLGLSLSDVDFVASPLKRTRETMEIVRDTLKLDKHAYPTDDRLKEISYGTFEGKTWAQMEEIDAPACERRRVDPFNWRPQGGESYADLSVRLKSWLITLKRDTIVVSHGGTSRALRGLLLNLAPHRLPELRVPQDELLVLQAGSARFVRGKDVVA